MNFDPLSDGKSLWMDEAGAAFWLIPDGAPLAPGGFAIRSVLGARRSVDGAALAPFAVTREQADARAREKLDAFGEALKQTVAQILQSPGAGAAAAIATELQQLESSVESGVRRLMDGMTSALHAVESLPSELEKMMRGAASRLAALAKRSS